MRPLCVLFGLPLLIIGAPLFIASMILALVSGVVFFVGMSLVHPGKVMIKVNGREMPLTEYLKRFKT